MYLITLIESRIPSLFVTSPLPILCQTRFLSPSIYFLFLLLQSQRERERLHSYLNRWEKKEKRRACLIFIWSNVESSATTYTIINGRDHSLSQCHRKEALVAYQQKGKNVPEPFVSVFIFFFHWSKRAVFCRS